MFCFLFVNFITAQEISDTSSIDLIQDSLFVNTFADTLFVRDSLLYLQKDTTISGKDTIPKKKKEGLDSPVKYTAKDSVIYDLDSQYVYLFGEAEVTYEDIILQAGYIRFDMAKKEVFSKGIPDSTGTTTIQNPIFKDGNDEYNAKILNYNFDTKEAYIESIITEQEGGFLHSGESKRQSNEQIHCLDNKYTTCDLEHPHFYIALKKAIVVPNKKIVSGPAHFVVEDVPLYFPFLPFGYFPTQKNRSAGILFPTFGDEATRGFYLRNLGYYWPINDYLDLTLMTDIYTKGDWGLRTNADYVKRYKFNGTFDFTFQKSIQGERGFEDYLVTKYYKVIWNHRQDPKANPTQTFSASVDFSTSGYERNYSTNIDEIFSNQKHSSISYTKRWDNTPLNTPFNISSTMNVSQNNRDNTVNLNFPNFSANTGNIYLFPKKDDEAKHRMWHDIRTKYTASMTNSYNSPDSLFWDNMKMENMNNGFQHSLPITLPAKLFKRVPLNISIGYQGWLSTKKTVYYWDINKVTNISGTDTTRGGFSKRIENGIYYTDKYNYVPSFSGITLTRNMYMLFQSTKPETKVQKVRYVMMPKAVFSFTPGRKGKTPKYYTTVYSPDRSEQYSYSEFGDSYYKPPGISRGSSATGSVALSLDNNIEMKVRSKSDTITELTKVKLLDNLSFRTNYNIFADSMHWSVINFNTGTSLFKKKVSIRMNGQLDPYALDNQNRRYDKFVWSEDHHIGRLTSMIWNIGLNFGSKTATSENKGKEEKEINDYDYFDVPWGLTVAYGWTYRKPTNIASLTQTLTFNGNVKFTKKWSFTYSSGYDIERKQFTTTYFNITRDLHCWAMSIRVVPFGSRKFFEFKINAVSSMLKDLKYEMDRNWRDY